MKIRYGDPEEVGMSRDKILKLEALQQEWVEKNVSPIIVSLIARRGVIVSHKLFIDPVYDQTYGPMKIDTIFQLASISKPITTTALLMLAEEGKVSPSLPVQDYIPEFEGTLKDKVLISNLMTHTSGINEEIIWDQLKSEKFSIDMAKCPENLHPDIYKLLEAGYKVPLKTNPGREMNYCNYGFDLLGEIIRRVTGKNLHEFVTERIFKPLSMIDSYYIVPDNQIKRIAKHPPSAPFPNFSDVQNLKRPLGSGGLCSTVYDMAIFCQMLLDGGLYGDERLLSPITVNKMTTNQIPGVSSHYGEEFFKEGCWGLGWNVSGNKVDYTGTLRSNQTYSHSGRGNTQIMVDPENEMILINFQITMKRINNRAYHYFEYFNDAALACIQDI